MKLQELPYRLLVLLVERRGQIVTREEVRQRIWQENTFVEFDNSLGVAVRKVRDALDDDAEAPRYVETIPRRGYRFVAPVAEVGGKPVVMAPAADVHKVAPSAALPDNAVARTALAPEPARSQSWIFIGLSLVLLIAVSLTYLFLRHRTSQQPSMTGDAGTAEVRVRRSVAVLGFRNLPGRPEDSWLSSAFSEMLSTELAADGALRMVSGEDIARAKRELPLADEDSLAKATLAKLRTDPGADVVVLGSYTPLLGKGEKRIRLDIRLQDTAHGETIAEEAFEGSENDLFNLVGQAGSALRKSLGTAPVSNQGAAQARAALPTKPKAVRLYTEGRARLWAFDYIHARDLLIQAVAVEPDFPLSHAALSEAWTHLGYAQKSRDQAERARALSEHLGVEERLLIEAQYYFALADYAKATERYQKLFAMFPDSLDYGLRLADTQRWINPADALQTLVKLRQLPSPLGEDPRIDMLEARAWINRDLIKARAAAARAVQKGKEQGLQQLLARAYGILCQLQGGAQTAAEAIEECQTSIRSYHTLGDRNNEARTMNDLAGIYYQQGDLDRSEALFSEAVKIFSQLGDIEGTTTSSSNLGDIYLARGNLIDAARVLSEALPGYREIGDKDGVALTFNDLGEIARLRGDLDAAFKNYQQGNSTASEIDDQRAIAYAESGTGDVLLDRGDLADARKSYEDALTRRKQIGDIQSVAESELSLAVLSIEDHHAADAESVIRKCIDQFHQSQQTDDEFLARVTLIQAFIQQSKYADAAKEADEAKSLAASSSNKLIQLQFTLLSARREVGLGDLKSARGQLEKTLQEAHTRHLFGFELETRLALAELMQKARETSQASAHLASLEKEAQEKSFGLLAAKAAALRGQTR